MHYCDHFILKRNNEINRHPKLATITELSKSGGGITNLSAVTLRRHIGEASIPRDDKKRYSVAKVKKAIAQHQARDGKNLPGAQNNSEATKARTAKWRVQAEMEQLKLAKMKGEMVPRRDHENALRSMALIVKSGLEGDFIKQISARLHNKTATATARRIVKATLNDLADRMEATDES